MKKIYIVVLIFLGVSLSESFSRCKWDFIEVIHYDVSGYYLYLPAVFIYHDLGRLEYYPAMNQKYRPTRDEKWYALYEQPVTHRRLDKYPLGIAIFELPAFLVAHAWCSYTDQYECDGYSIPYQMSVSMSTILWSVLGLLMLGRFLTRLFSSNTAAITVALIGFGTNLYAYTNMETGMSHPFLFFLFATLLCLTERWYSTLRPHYLYLAGLTLGWIVISRPTGMLITMIPLFWMAGSKEDLRGRWKLFKSQWVPISVSILCFFAVASLQMIYWKYITGHFIVFSYQQEGFNFADPQIWNGLFSFRKGWFIYTPLALIAMTGFIPLYKQYKKLVWLLVLYFAVTIYVIFSWWQWYYGWGFGSRPMVDSLPLLSIPLAALVQYIMKARWVLKGIGILVGGFCIWLNIYQSNQYATGALPGDWMTYEYYKIIWNKMHGEEEYNKYLRP